MFLEPPEVVRGGKEIFLEINSTGVHINPLSTKLYLSDLKTNFLPHSKHSLLRF